MGLYKASTPLRLYGQTEFSESNDRTMYKSQVGQKKDPYEVDIEEVRKGSKIIEFLIEKMQRDLLLNCSWGTLIL